MIIIFPNTFTVLRTKMWTNISTKWRHDGFYLLPPQKRLFKLCKACKYL